MNREKIIRLIAANIFQIRFFVLLGGIVAIVLVTYNIEGKEGVEVKDLVAVVTGGVVVLTLFYHMINYEYNQRKFKHDIKVQREVLSFNTAVEWHKPTMVGYVKDCSNFMKINKNIIDERNGKAFFDELEKPENENKKIAVISILNYFESISLGVKQGIMDEEFIKGFFGSIFANYYYDFSFYVEFRRNSRKNQKIWNNFTYLARKWAECDDPKWPIEKSTN